MISNYRIGDSQLFRILCEERDLRARRPFFDRKFWAGFIAGVATELGFVAFIFWLVG